MNKSEEAPVTAEECQSYKNQWGLILTRMVYRAREMSLEERQREIRDLEQLLPNLFGESAKEFTVFALKIHRLPNEELTALCEFLSESSLTQDPRSGAQVSRRGGTQARQLTGAV